MKTDTTIKCLREYNEQEHSLTSSNRPLDYGLRHKWEVRCQQRVSQNSHSGRPDDQIVRLSCSKAHQGGSKRRSESPFRDCRFSPRQPLDTAPEKTGPARGERIFESFFADVEPFTPSSRLPLAAYRGAYLFIDTLFSGLAAADNEAFARLKRLLLDHDVAIMMAGDTHDLEYYAEPAPRRPDLQVGRDGIVHYFVNGGGGAYLSFGTALQWPESPPTAEWAYYPNKQVVTDKIVARSPAWKRPAWWWTTRFNAWPFSAEWLSGVFDYNVAPFFQSFFEVRVEPSAHRVRLLPYGIYGQLQWKDLAHSANPAGRSVAENELVQWVVPMQ